MIMNSNLNQPVTWLFDYKDNVDDFNRSNNNILLLLGFIRQTIVCDDERLRNIRCNDLCCLIDRYLSQSYTIFFGKTKPKSGEFTENDKKLHLEFRKKIETEDVQFVGFLFFEPERCIVNCQLLMRNSSGTKVFIHANNSAAYGWVSIDNPRLLASDTQTMSHSRNQASCPQQNDTHTIIFDNFIKFGNTLKNNNYKSDNDNNCNESLDISDKKQKIDCDYSNYSVKIKFLNNYCSGGSQFVKLGIFGINRCLLQACYEEVNFEQLSLHEDKQKSIWCKDGEIKNTSDTNDIITSENNIIKKTNTNKDDKVTNLEADYSSIASERPLFVELLVDRLPRAYENDFAIDNTDLETINTNQHTTTTTTAAATDDMPDDSINSLNDNDNNITSSFDQLMSRLPALIRQHNKRFSHTVVMDQAFDFDIIDSNMMACKVNQISDTYDKKLLRQAENKVRRDKIEIENVNNDKNSKITDNGDTSISDDDYDDDDCGWGNSEISHPAQVDLSKFSLKYTNCNDKNKGQKCQDNHKRLKSAMKQSIHEITMSFAQRIRTVSQSNLTGDNNVSNISNRQNKENKENRENKEDKEDKENKENKQEKEESKSGNVEYEYCFVLKDNIFNIKKEFILSNDNKQDFEYIVFMEFENCHCHGKIPYVVGDMPVGHRFAFDWSTAKR